MCALDGFLEVLREPAASPEPGEGTFHHPSSRQDLEALRLIGSLDDLEGPGPDLAQPSFEFGATTAPSRSWISAL